MYSRTLAVLMVAATCSPAPPAWSSAADVANRPVLLATDLDPRLAAVIGKYRLSIPKSMEEQRVPGLAIALVFGGKLVWAEGFGVTDNQSGLPITPDTMFSVQSISKTYTATAVMAAVDEGKVALDEPITTYLPAITVHSRFEENPQKKITLRLLLSHHAGFTHEAPKGSNYERTASFDEHIRSISDTWLRFPVGQRYAYSNLGVDLAGHVLEVVYKRPFPEVLDEKIFRPLRLQHTTADLTTIRQSKIRAIGHAKGYDRPPVGMAMIPAGGVYTSANDMARFMQFHMYGGRWANRSLIRKDILDFMYVPCCGSEVDSYGLGIGEAKSRYGNTVVTSRGHSGGGDGFLSDMYWFSELGLGIAILTNSDSHQLQARLLNSIAQDVFESFIGKKQPQVVDETATSRTPIEIDDHRLRQLAGHYSGSRPMDLVLQDSRLGLSLRSDFYPAVFFAADEMELKLPFITMTCRFRSDGQRDPAWADCTVEMGALNHTESMVYNGGPFDARGPDKPGWQAYLGDYEIWLWGKPVETIALHVDNGYLYFGKERVIDEYLPGLFFLADGEALDLRTSTPTFRNIPLTRNMPDKE